MGICVITHNQAKKWEDTDVRPNCSHHFHVSAKQAYIAIEDDNANWFDGPSSRAIVFHDCVLRYEWQTRKSIGFNVLQMVPIRK